MSRRAATRLVRSVLHRVGADVVRYPTLATEGERLVRLLRSHRITTVLDVGANTGQFAGALRRRGFQGRIHSFEPLPDAYRELVRRSAHDDAWHAHRVALSARRETLRLNVAANSTSSSVLPMLDSHLEAAPGSRYVSTELVEAITVGDVVEGLTPPPGDRLFLKIDAQGYEMPVLEGARSVWSAIHGVQLELSLVPLYAGQLLLPEMLAWTVDRGLELVAVAPGFSDPASGRMLQMDGVFFRRDG